MKISPFLKVTLILAFSLIILYLVRPLYLKPQDIPSDTYNHQRGQDNTPPSFLYPNSSLVSSQMQDSENYSAEFNTTDSVPAVSSWYAEKLTQQGWLIDTSDADSSNFEIQTIKANKGNLSLIISAIQNPDNKTKIVIAQWTKSPDEDEELDLED